jgi:hypothetical protein
MKGAVTTPDLPLGLQAQLRRVRETRRALGGGLAGQILREQGLEPRASLLGPGALTPGLGAMDAFQKSHQETLKSIRSLTMGPDLSAASEQIAEKFRVAGLGAGIGKALQDDIARTAGIRGLSESAAEAARIAVRSARLESNAIGLRPDFVRDASSIAFGGTRRTRDLLGDDPLGALGISGKRWNEQFETLTRGFAPMFGEENAKALAGLRGVVAGQDDFERISRHALAAIRGVTPELGVADRFDFSSFLPGHWRGAEGLSSVIAGGIVDQAQIEKLSRTALAASGTLAPDFSERIRGVFESSVSPWAKGGIYGESSFGSALELNSVFGADAGKQLRGLDLAGLGAGLDPAMSRSLVRGLGAEFDLARGVIDSSAWAGLHDFPDLDWAGLRASAEAAREASAGAWAEEPEADPEAVGRETVSLADRLREMGFWLPGRVPLPAGHDKLFWAKVIVSSNPVAEAMASGDPRRVFFTLMGVLLLFWGESGGPQDGD